jgi:hypothetical protein
MPGEKPLMAIAFRYSHYLPARQILYQLPVYWCQFN